MYFQKFYYLLFIIMLQSCIGAGTNSQIEVVGDDFFPKMVGIDLQGNERQLPQSFDAKLNLVIVAFKREQQVDVDSWIKVFPQIFAKNSQINFYELPIIYELGAFSRMSINNGMRRGVKGDEARSRTITIYTNRTKFFDLMKMQEDKIYALLIDQSGKILWQKEGVANVQNVESLQNFITKLPK